MESILNWMQNPRRWFGVSLVVLLLGSAWMMASAVPNSETTGGQIPSPREGFLAPDFTLDQLNGGQIRLADLRGKVLLINLWATWCPPCRAEMPAIQRVYEANRGLGFEVLAVNMTHQDSEQSAAAFVEQHGLTFPVLLDRTGQVGRLYLMRALPSTFLVDREGVIQQVMIGGPLSEVTIQTAVETILGEGS
jgi:cytochrome c biogenesis protein CcmG/thiol:disulfide interchange protein DsbE